MSYYIRKMREGDIRQVTDIDREAFPTMLPPVNFRSELQNRLAHYVVACDTDRTIDAPEGTATRGRGFFKGMSKLIRVMHPGYLFDIVDSEVLPYGTEYIAGYAGIWILVDEAHVTSIGVRETCQGQGIGELMLISTIEQATKLKARLLTLEVRVSNVIAQNLYRKYGFTKIGVRRGYYSDTNEDGILMSTDDIVSDGFQERFQKLKEAHAGKWRMACCQVSR